MMSRPLALESRIKVIVALDALVLVALGWLIAASDLLS